MTDGFSRSIWISMMCHGIVVMLIFLRAVFLPPEPIQIRNAIRVDVVALPDKEQTLPETPAPAEAEPKPAPAAKTEPKPKPEPSAAPAVPDPKAKKKDLSKTQKKALDKLRALEALDKIKDEVRKEKSAAKAAAVRGNQVSAGNSLTGLERVDYDRYFDEIKTKVLGQWTLPQWLADAQLKASVTVLIDAKGFVIKRAILRSSGNEVFDAKAIEAVEASSPLPPPPERLRGLVSTSGIVFNFPE